MPLCAGLYTSKHVYRRITLKKFDLTKRILDSGALAVVRATPSRVVEIAESIVKGGIDVM